MSKKAELNYQDIQLKELEKKTGISKNTLGNYLTGHNSAPSVDNAVKIAAALGVSVEYLVTGRCGGAFADSLPPKIEAVVTELKHLDDIDLDSVALLVQGMKKRYVRSGRKKIMPEELESVP